jgi:hypothetical protein
MLPSVSQKLDRAHFWINFVNPVLLAVFLAGGFLTRKTAKRY